MAARLSLIWVLLLLLFSSSPAVAYGISPSGKTQKECWAVVMTGNPTSDLSACYSLSGAIEADKPWLLKEYSQGCDPVSAGTIQVNADGWTRWAISSVCRRTDGSTYDLYNTTIVWYHPRTVDVPQCPAMSRDIGGQCVCDAGYKSKLDGGCEPNPCPVAGTLLDGSDGQSYQITGASSSSPPTVACVAGCVVAGSLGVAWQKNGQWVNQIAGPLRSTGAQCNPQMQGGTLSALGADQPGNQTNGAPAVCKAPKCPGQVNGADVCVPCGATSTSSVTSAGDQAAGGTITSTDCTGGTCTTKTGTVDANGKVTWTQTTTGSGQSATGTAAGGAGQGGDGESQEQSSFCADNPESPLCKAGAFGGACGAFTCTGDGVQCAMAKEQHERNCQLFDPTSKLVKDGEAAMSGDAASAPSSSTVSVDFSTKIDTTDALSAACPGDRVIALSSYSITLPFGRLCQEAQLVKAVALAITALVCVRIVFGA